MWRYNIILLTIGLCFLGADDYIMFPHQMHVEDMEMSCEDCHAEVAESEQVPPRLLPEKDTCIGCHDGDSATEDCEACHADPDEPLPFSDSQPLAATGFSHTYHLSKAMDCSSCHDYILEDDGSTDPYAWSAGDCQSCHSESVPASHNIEWAWLHGMEVTHQTQASCITCHVQSTCDACHQVQEVTPRVHPTGFILGHGLEAYNGLNDCASCHNSILECQSCHQQNMVMPLDHNLSNWAGELLNDGGLHGDEAMNNPDICMACHQPNSSTCTRCHTN